MTEHKPSGPWEVYFYGSEPYREVWVQQGDGRELLLGTMLNEEWERDCADAYLIAAAPDLLAACEASLAHITGDGRDGTYGEHKDNPVPLQLRVAIAKARGGSAKRIRAD